MTAIPHMEYNKDRAVRALKAELKKLEAELRVEKLDQARRSAKHRINEYTLAIKNCKDTIANQQKNLATYRKKLAEAKKKATPRAIREAAKSVDVWGVKATREKGIRATLRALELLDGKYIPSKTVNALRIGELLSS